MSSAVTYTSPEMLTKLAEWHVYGNEQQGRFLTKYPEQEPTYYGVEIAEDIRNNIFKRQLGKKSYELKDHLGNVRTTFSDIKMPTGSGSQPFRVDLLSKSEYYPYGMVIDELSYNLSNNRYGFGGTHEMDNEVKGGVGNHLSFGDFGYDTRVARRFNLDPIDQIFISNYAGFGNNPIYYTDPSGYSPSDPGNGGGSNNSNNSNEVKIEPGGSITGGPTEAETIPPVITTGNKGRKLMLSDNTATQIKSKAQETSSNRIVDLKEISVFNEKGEALDKGIYSTLIKNYNISDINSIEVPSGSNVSAGIRWGFGFKLKKLKVGGAIDIKSWDINGNTTNGMYLDIGVVTIGSNITKSKSRDIFTIPRNMSVPFYYPKKLIGNEHYEFQSISFGGTKKSTNVAKTAIVITQHIEIYNLPLRGSKKYLIEKTIYQYDFGLSFDFLIFHLEYDPTETKLPKY